MERYFKKFFLGHLLVFIIAVFACLYFSKSPVIIILLFVGLIELLAYNHDAKYLPKRRDELTNKLIQTFNAEPFSAGVMKFKIGKIDFFAEIVVDFKLGFQIAHVETIKFHIPRTQIEQLSKKPEFVLIEDNIDEIQTYNIYQTSGSGLKLAKGKLEKMI